MKEFYLLLIGLCGFGMQAQIISFPDLDFKAAILANPMPVDGNGDGEISQQEAADAFDLYLDGTAIDNLEGLQYFTGLSVFYLTNTSVTSVTVPDSAMLWEINILDNSLLTTVNMPFSAGLGSVDISNNDALQALDLSGLTDIAMWLTINGNASLTMLNLDGLVTSENEFKISNNPLLVNLSLQALENSYSNFEITNNQNLTTLDVSGVSFDNVIIENNGLTSINLENTNYVYYLSLADNQLETLDLSMLTTPGYSMLDLSGNNYTDLNFVGPWSQLESGFSNGYTALYLSHTHLTSINFNQPVHLSTLTISDNLELETISFRNGSFETCDGGYCSIGSVGASNNPALQLVCTDAFEGYALESEFYVSGTDWAHEHIDPNVAVSENCFFEPAGNYNTVSGILRFDAGSDGCSVTDTVLAHVPVTTNGYQATTFTNSSGTYHAFTTFTQMNVSANVNPVYFTVSPATQTVNFTGTGNTETVDFCIAPNGSHNDLAIDVIPVDAAIAGFDTHYKIVYRNNGTTTQSGTVTAGFWDDEEFVSASITPDSQAGGNLIWNFSNLEPFESRMIDIVLNVNGPLDTPPINSGNTVYLTAWVTAGTDETTADNLDSAIKTVVNSFDPNDKQVSQGVAMLVGEAVEKGLTYTIRFQNTGTAPAQRVVITDVLDSDFNLYSVQPIASSHPYEMRRRGNLLEFWFEDINLPTETENEPGSHGFVTFNVKSTQASDLGWQYQNTANIYFDYNAAIVTNTTTTDVYQLGTSNPFSQEFTLYPNPASSVVNIFSRNGNTSKIEVCNLFGQAIMTFKEAESHTIDVSGLSSGTYLIKVSSDKGKETHKLIKL
ncbi:T9SS type A sorting domain-containing protein [Flavobacterium sp. MAH-1]|uniref:T9SS type A sorting domain-containing protein n=1 Tax=Flavobacterium agri TaxID=2743471 RepID=A0A7Y9C467_9FLAO|nr:T9SS type A sorting domain-containing protein [Flavobacterium agri]NUY79560.1 T9SS type A sorting domain-containing protein [Flavobacterium agri]NYA69585.1 T9SS type A sorting domain-containing protein [Flavobacterium agri]